MNLNDLLKKSKNLNKFKVSDQPIKSQQTNPFEVQRDRFRHGIAVQLEAIAADKAGVKFEKLKEIKVENTDKETGEVTVKTENKSLRFKRWYEKVGPVYVVVLRYGPAQLFDQAITAKTLDEVEELLNAFLEETNNGNLDEAFKKFQRGPRKPKNGTPEVRNIVKA